MNPFGPSSHKTGSTVPVGCPLPVFSKALLVAMLCIFSCSLASAQTSVYHPFPDSNAVWGMSAGCTDWNCGAGNLIQDYYAGDTLMDGYNYKIIHESIGGYYGSCLCGVPGGLGAGYLRDDTIARKVYWRWHSMAGDSLLYDFTLEVGDTLKGLLANAGLCAEVVLTVQAIDSLLVGGSYRKRIVFTDPDACHQTAIIEGVGSTNGLTACSLIPASFGILLTCFSVDGEVVYMNPCSAPDVTACGELPSTIRDTSTNLRGVEQATPNPSTGLFHIGQASRQISVYNAQGKLLFRQHGNEVDLGAYPPGVYTAVVQTAQGRSVQRLVVVR